MNPFLGQVVGGILRAVLAALGGAAWFSDDQVNQLAGALAVIGVIGWSAWQKYRARSEAY